MSSGNIKEFIETCILNKECKPAMSVANVAACKSPPERAKKRKEKHKVETNYNN
jgi:hypothetical protein